MAEDVTPPVLVNFSQVIGGGGANEAVAQVGRALADDNEAAAAQAVLSQALVALKDAETHPDVMSSPDDQRAALLQSFLAEQAEAEGLVDVLPVTNAREAKFDEHDLVRWVASRGWSWIKLRLSGGRNSPFLPTPEPADWHDLADDTRVAILGDWGTGMYGAPRCANSISADHDRFGAVVHLGDVYYAGTHKEVRQNFLNHWPKVSGAINRACNSNHEMYSGGGPYFTATLSEFGQTSSVFVLQNKFWVIVGLDTAYEEHRVGVAQVKFLRQVVDRLGDRKLVILSHHQPFSRLARQGTGLQQDLGDELLSKVFAWYWGHEHICALYEPSERWGLNGRCIGHGGFPYFRPDELRAQRGDRDPGDQLFVTLPAKGDIPGARLLDGPNPYVEGHAQDYGPHGYLALHLDGEHLQETVYDCDGHDLLRNELA